MSWWRREKTKGGGFWLFSSEFTVWLWLSMMAIAMIAATLAINLAGFLSAE